LLHATFSAAGSLPSPSGIGFHALINYCGGAFVYVRREYAGALIDDYSNPLSDFGDGQSQSQNLGGYG